MDYKLSAEYARKQTKRQAALNEARQVKTQAYALGYVHAISFYGVLDWLHIPHAEYRRIEVLSNSAYTPTILQQLMDFFSAVKPLRTYSIWLYTTETGDLMLTGEWE